MVSWETAFSNSVACHFASSHKTLLGKAFCWNGFGSSFQKVQSRLSLLSMSQVGFPLLFLHEVVATNKIVFLTVFSAKGPHIGPENIQKRE